MRPSVPGFTPASAPAPATGARPASAATMMTTTSAANRLMSPPSRTPDVRRGEGIVQYNAGTRFGSERAKVTDGYRRRLAERACPAAGPLAPPRQAAAPDGAARGDVEPGCRLRGPGGIRQDRAHGGVARRTVERRLVHGRDGLGRRRGLRGRAGRGGASLRACRSRAPAPP